MLRHARIQPEGHPAFDVLFNPGQYTVEKTNQLAESAVPGLESTIIQYVCGNARTLSMELFFDTYEEGTDVRDHTEKIFGLLAIDPDKHAPPICEITWGTFSFTGVLSQASGRFTLFLPDGTPARATVTVTFKEYAKVQDLVRQRPTRSADHYTSVLVQRGDTLPNISHQVYGDARLWRRIAAANNLDNPLDLPPGMELILPQLQ